MKFTGALSTLLVVLPFLVLQVSAAPGALAARQGRGGKGSTAKGKGGAKAAGNNNNNAKGGNAGKGAAAGAAGGAAAGAAGGAAAGNATAGGAAAANSTADAGAAAGGAAAGGDEQSSLTLDPSVIGPNLALNGLAGNGTEAGQVASATSTNNFINFCVGKTITNGLQVQGGSCNSIPMGDIPAKTAQTSAKFQFPTNLANIAENTDFTIKMAIQGLETGNFVNPNTNYFGAPQALNAQGQIIGHSHVVVQLMPSVTDTTPLDPTVFAFFQGLNAAADNGVLSADVAKGLPAGAYRLFSINTAANHQPVIGPVAQHGSFDDAVYFTVGDAAAAAAASAVGGAAAAGGAASNATAAAGGAAAGGAAAGGAAAGAAGGAAAGAAAGAAGAAKGAAAGAKGAAAGAAGAAKGAATAAAGAAKGAAAAGKGAAATAAKGGNNNAKGGKGRRSFNISRQN